MFTHYNVTHYNVNHQVGQDAPGFDPQGAYFANEAVGSDRK